MSRRPEKTVMGTAVIPIQLSQAEQKLLQALIYEECGMFFDDNRVHFLQDRLQRRLRSIGLDTFYEYYRLLMSSDGKAELTTLLENLTVNETSFFRNKPQLDLFHKVILEEILQRKQQHRDFTLRAWSAGCSTGPEPYSMAMLICDALAYYYLRHPLPFEMPSPRPIIPPPWRIEILASDINYSVLRSAVEGFYPDKQMEPVDFSYRLRYFDKVENGYMVKKNLKKLVQFDFHNLKAEFLPARNDIIFCRNVMIYFDQAEQKRLLDKFYRCLNPHGYLLTGHTESLFGLSDRFRMIHQNNGTVYQRIEVPV